MNTGRLTLFDSPLFLGFEDIEKTFDRLRKSGGEGYPPYNIEQIGESNLRITLAVAGFSMEDLDIEVENNQLVIRGRRPMKMIAFICIAGLRRVSSNAALCLRME